MSDNVALAMATALALGDGYDDAYMYALAVGLMKRSLEEEDDEPQPSRKRSRLSTDTDESNTGSDPYTTLPSPTTSFIQLRLQLCRFNGVYRIVQLPLNYTFANLHRLIMYLFGWGGLHTHEARVFSNVEMYSGNYKRGHIKNCGRVAPLTEEDLDDPYYHHFAQFARSDEPLYTVVSQGRKRSCGQGYDSDSSTKVEDQELTLGDVWSLDEEENASQGECSTEELAIKYEYDLGASWEIHITCETGEPFFTVKPASNTPRILKAKGAPPIEDARHEVYGELEGNKKTVSTDIFIGQNFARYLNGELASETRKRELVVFNFEEERARLEEKARLRRERYEMREQELEERRARGEDDYEEYDEEDSDSDYE